MIAAVGVSKSFGDGRSLAGLVQHSDHGSQYLSIRYTGRLLSEGIEASTASWVEWYNHTRPHRTNPDELPPATVEDRYYDHTTTPASAAA